MATLQIWVLLAVSSFAQTGLLSTGVSRVPFGRQYRKGLTGVIPRNRCGKVNYNRKMLMK